jgi:outer membrane receptor for ferrienterochelin and colicin
MRKITYFLLFLLCSIATVQTAWSQGVTTAAINGVVKDAKGEGLPGATVVAVHVPSGSQYATSTQPDGRFAIQGMRVGGPYTITTTFIGFQDNKLENVYLTLGNTLNLNVKLSEGEQTLDVVEVVSAKGSVISGERTGAATSIAKEQIERMPTINRSFADMTRMTPQANGNSFGGRSGSFNNITIDGALFNNVFGLSGTIGGQTGSQPISLDAIEQIQVNIAPYDVRQGSFTGAGINAVTRSGTNELSGSVYAFNRTDGLLGNKVGSQEILNQSLSVWQVGARLGGAILKNKLFFFVSWESERQNEPATSFTALRDGQTAGGNISQASAKQLDELSAFLKNKFGYETGPYDNFQRRTVSDKATVKLDWNISDKHKFNIKYNYLRSFADIPPSNSGAIASRSAGQFGMPYFASYYIINNNLNSVIAELNSRFSNEVSNTFQIGWTSMRDFRESPGGIFPMVDIGNGAGQQLTAFGYEPFSAFNKLDTDVFQFSNNLTIYKGKHTLTVGTYNEFYKFANGFAPNYYGGYQFNSLESFYASVRVWEAQKNNQTPTPEDLALGIPRQYQLQYSALPDRSFPLAKLSAFQVGLYVQDEWAVRNNLNVTAGLRVDMPFIDADIKPNPAVNDLVFADNRRIDVSRTQKLAALWSPRLGFNWDVFNNKKTQVRGGTGIFTGRVPFVWISNQVGNTGNLFGSLLANPTATTPLNQRFYFNPDVSFYIPANNAPSAGNTAIAITDPNFKFPQIWRTNLAIDQELPWGVIGTLEGIYTSDLNAVYHRNINLPAPQRTFKEGEAGSRPVFPGTARINPGIQNAILMSNTNLGYSYSLTAQLQKTFARKLYTSVAYTYTDAQSVNDGGSIAASIWRDRPVSGDPNANVLAPSNFLVRHRVVASASYKVSYAKYFATTISMFFEAAPAGRFSYLYSGDVNNDRAGGNNDLIYVPRSSNEINLRDINGFDANGVPFTYSASQQWADLDKFISQDPYLSTRRGQYAERNGAEQPWFAKADLSIRQDFILDVKGKKNTLQLSFDVFNFTNLLNSDWGVIKTPSRSALLTFTNSYDAAGNPVYTFPYLNNNTRTPLTQSFINNPGTGSRWIAQIGLRYIFN